MHILVGNFFFFLQIFFFFKKKKDLRELRIERDMIKGDYAKRIMVAMQTNKAHQEP